MKKCNYCGGQTFDDTESCRFCGSSNFSYFYPHAELKQHNKKEIKKKFTIILLSAFFVLTLTMVDILSDKKTTTVTTVSTVEKKEESIKIGIDEAADISLGSAGFLKEDVKKLSVKCGNKGDTYKVSFKKGKKEYNYKIDAVTGNVLKVTIKKD